MDKTNSYA